jgi:hypothetical protein
MPLTVPSIQPVAVVTDDAQSATQLSCLILLLEAADAVNVNLAAPYRDHLASIADKKAS